MKRILTLNLLFCAVIFSPTIAFASDAEDTLVVASIDMQAAEIVLEQELEHPTLHNHIAFLAMPMIASGQVTAVTGIEYEHIFGKGLWGIAGEFEFLASPGHPGYVVAMGVVVHPIAGFKAFVMPLLEIHDGHAVAMGRIGLGYDFHIGNFSIGPVADLDFNAHHFAQLYGLAFGVGF